MTLRDAALSYAYRGWPVLPLRGKLPLTAHGLQDASTDTARIVDWWRANPGANIGVRCSACYVLDVDPRHQGDQHLAELARVHGSLRGPLVRTGSGGYHLYFRPLELAEGESLRRHPVEGCDGCGPGHYVVAPPSVHPDTGQPYRWVRRIEDPLPELPPWLWALAVRTRPQTPALDVPVRDQTRYAAGALRRECEACREAPEGQRHTVLVRAAWNIGGLVRGGQLDERTARAALLEAISRPHFTARDVWAAERTIGRQFEAAPVR